MKKFLIWTDNNVNGETCDVFFPVNENEIIIKDYLQKIIDEYEINDNYSISLCKDELHYESILKLSSYGDRGYYKSLIVSDKELSLEKIKNYFNTVLKKSEDGSQESDDSFLSNKFKKNSFADDVFERFYKLDIFDFIK